jgi:hypothetical protein
MLLPILYNILAVDYQRFGLFIAPLGISVQVLSLLALITLFVFVPVAFLGMLAKIFGVQKSGTELEFRSLVRSLATRFFQCLTYHIVLFGGWFIFANSRIPHLYKPTVTPTSETVTLSATAPFDQIFTKTDILGATYLLVSVYMVGFVIYVLAYAVITVYLMYYLRRFRGRKLFYPKLSNIARLATWNIFIFLFASIVLQLLSEY